MPKNQNVLCYFFLSLFTLLLMASCGTSDEVRTIDEAPRTADQQTTIDDTSEVFTELSIGLIDTVDNLDPLFASNLSTMRVLSLIYDGLLTLDKNGDVIPAMATEVAVSEDSLTYTLTIDTDLFYHNNTSFTSGVGRRIDASDIKWAFERTAMINVPKNASQLLFNIAGYEEFFEEQRNIYDPNRRSLSGVDGITVDNPQTIQFRLLEPDPGFEKKLTSPYLFIYPREAVQSQSSSLKSNPVGTGAYQFQNRTETSIVVSRVNSDTVDARFSQPQLNTITFMQHPDERELFQNFASNNIHWIPEIGPETKQAALTDTGELEIAYQDNYIVRTSGSRVINIFINNTPRINLNWLRNRLSQFDPYTLDTPEKFTVHQPLSQINSDAAGDPDPFYLISYTDDMFAKNFLAHIQEVYLEPDSEFRLSQLRTPVLQTAIYTTSSDSYHNQLMKPASQAWLSIDYPIAGLHQLYVNGIENNTVPWKLFIESVQVEEISEAHQ